MTRTWALLFALLIAGCTAPSASEPTASSQPAVTAADSRLDCEGDELVVTTETQIVWDKTLHTVATIGCRTPAGLSGERVEVFEWQAGWQSAGYISTGDELWNTDSGCFTENGEVVCSVFVWQDDLNSTPGTLWVGVADGQYAARVTY